jgi:type IV secretory pathway VirB2 component (pilin)
MMRRSVIVRLTPRHVAKSSDTCPLAGELDFAVDMRKLVMLNQFKFRQHQRERFSMAFDSDVSFVRRLSVTVFTALLFLPTLAFAQSPWERAASNLERTFTGPLARSLALVAIVIGGLMFMFGEGGAKRQISGIVFGGGLALFAAQFLVWLF